MVTLHIDIETFSSIDLKKSGVYKYVQSPDFEIMLFAYAFNDDSVCIVDLKNGEKIPNDVMYALSDTGVIKYAHNAVFEICCLSKYVNLNISQWRCTMAMALYNGYPAALAAVASAMGVSEDKKKMSAGHALIRKFCVPCLPTAKNGNRKRNLPHHEPEQWQMFKRYCVRDVEAERELHHRLVPLPLKEQTIWCLDLEINMRGIKIDTELMAGALQIKDSLNAELAEEAMYLTGLNNPNSGAQLKRWLSDALETEVDSLTKANIPTLIDATDITSVKRVLKIRQEMSKTSVKKYETMSNALCTDGRIRGLLQYYGANRTGRWAGRLVQVHNLPRNYLPTLGLARKHAKDSNGELLKVLYGNVTDTLSQLIRTAFIPKENHKFAVADFSAIEARVIAWLADESWRLEVFRTHGKIYESSASVMFGVPLEKIKKGNVEYELRQKGKVAELALGYQGAAGALIQMGALNMGLSEDELPSIVSRWRGANKRICDLWYRTENAVIDCIAYCTPQYLPHGVIITKNADSLIIHLPSGRELYYIKPHLLPGKFGKEQMHYYGVDGGKWGRISTYGGKLTENIVQAIARDCLAEAMQSVNCIANLEIVMHIHDEIVVEVPEINAEKYLQAMIEQMSKPIVWGQGLPLNADGFTTYYYKKE